MLLVFVAYWCGVFWEEGVKRELRALLEGSPDLANSLLLSVYRNWDVVFTTLLMSY